MLKTLFAYPGLIIWQLLGRLALRRFRYRLDDAPRINQAMLEEILRDSRDTAIGHRFAFQKILESDDPVAEYRVRVPLNDYFTFTDDIQKIAGGSADILFPGIPELFVATSGTSSDPKLLPMRRRQQNIALCYIALLTPAMRRLAAPQLKTGQRSINLMLASNPANALPGGAPLGMSSAGGMRRVLRVASFIWTSPAQVFQLTDHAAALYLHALFGLQDKSAGGIEAIFSSHIVSWIAMLMEKQRSLISDVATGRISTKIGLSTRERRHLEASLRPNPARAAELESAFAQGEPGIIARLWPDMRVLSTIVSGSFAVSLPRLQRMAGNQIRIYTTCFGATESMVGINIWPEECEKYALSIGAAYYEFLPIAETDSPMGQALSLKDLSRDGCYEIIVTTFSGLYRYRLGDVVRITDWVGNTPVFEFDFRIGTVLDLVGEKTTEQQTQAALFSLARKAFGSEAAICNYTLTGDYSAVPYRYCIYLELTDSQAGQASDLRELAKIFDQELQQTNLSYRTLARANKRLATPRVKLVRPGTFELLENHRYKSTHGISRNQIKVPRLIRDKEQIQILENNLL